MKQSNQNSNRHPWDAGTTRGSFTCYATVPAPAFIFSSTLCTRILHVAFTFMSTTLFYLIFVYGIEEALQLLSCVGINCWKGYSSNFSICTTEASTDRIFFSPVNCSVILFKDSLITNIKVYSSVLNSVSLIYMTNSCL